MSLNFPNASRSYDEREQCVRFWGYDGALEICFFVDQRAIARISPGTPFNEMGFLRAFDLCRDQILNAAARIYTGRRRESYTLLAKDF